MWSDVRPVKLISMDNNNTKLLRPALFAEKQLIQNIVNGVWKPGDNLPSERILAQQLGITRQTLRETLKTLSTEGWVTIKHGKPSVVNDFISQGSLGVLKTLVKHCDLIPKKIIKDWLEFRTILLPELAHKATHTAPQEILKKLSTSPAPAHSPQEFSNYDWQLQELFVTLSDNSIARMIFNDTKQAYLKLALKYFQLPENRQSSSQYYIELEHNIINNNLNIKKIVKKAMDQSIKNYIKMTVNL